LRYWHRRPSAPVLAVPSHPAEHRHIPRNTENRRFPKCATPALAVSSRRIQCRSVATLAAVTIRGPDEDRPTCRNDHPCKSLKSLAPHPRSTTQTVTRTVTRATDHCRSRWRSILPLRRDRSPPLCCRGSVRYEAQINAMPQSLVHCRALAGGKHRQQAIVSAVWLAQEPGPAAKRTLPALRWREMAQRKVLEPSQ